MATGTEILNSKEWQGASQAEREKIFARKVAKDPEYANQSAEVQNLIRERFFPSAEEPVVAEKADEGAAGLTDYPAIEEAPAAPAAAEAAETAKPAATPIRKDTAVMAGLAAGPIASLIQKFAAAPDALQREIYKKSLKNALAEAGIDVANIKKDSDLIEVARQLVPQANIGKEQQLAALREQADALRALQPPVSTGFPSPIEQPTGRIEPTLRASGPRREGASSVENYISAAAGAEHQVPDVLKAQGTDYTKTSPTGGHAIIQRDLRNLETIKNLGAGDYQLVGQGRGQLMLPPEAGAQKMSRDAQVAKEALAVILPQISQLEREIAQASARGQDITEFVAKLEELKRAERSARQMTRGMNIPSQAGLGPLETLGTRARPTTKAGLGASVLGHTLAGGSAGYNIAEAMQEEDPIAKALGYTAAGFDIASMVPPIGIGAPIKGAGIVGGLAMPAIQYGYEKLLKPPKKSVMEKK